LFADFEMRAKATWSFLSHIATEAIPAIFRPALSSWKIKFFERAPVCGG
jgi:hypothetical protein